MNWLSQWSPEDIIAAVSLIVAAVFGAKWGMAIQQNSELMAKVQELQLEAKMQANKDENDRYFAGRSDDDVLDEAISSGRPKVPKD